MQKDKIYNFSTTTPVKNKNIKKNKTGWLGCGEMHHHAV